MSTEPDTTNSTPDDSPYIRTFAKDYVALSGKNPEEARVTSKKTHRSKKNKSAGQFTEESTPSVFPQPVPKPPADLSEIELQAETAEQDVENNLRELAKGSQVETPEPISLPRIIPGDIIQKAPEDSADILARLKARALENSITDPTLEPLVPVPPAPETTPIKATQEDTPSPLHTYTTDFQQHIQEEHATPFSILAAEKDAPSPQPVRQKKNSGGLLPVMLGIFLLLGGTAAITAAYMYMSKNAPVVSISEHSSLITPDSRIMLSGSGPVLLKALADQASQPLANNNILLTYVDESTTTPQGAVEAPASGGAFISELNLQAPDILLRNIDPESMVGIVSAGGETHAFFILRVESYERTFAGMLQWEPTLLTELSALYPEYPAPVAAIMPISTTTRNKITSSSTQQTQIVLPSNLPSTQFIDETVDSHDVRALKDNMGHTLVLYGYADKQTLIIARNEAAFTLLLNRLQTTTS